MHFPTQAEQALASWNKIQSLVEHCRRKGATRYDEGKVIVFNFKDDSNLEITGRGANHKVVATLP